MRHATVVKLFTNITTNMFILVAEYVMNLPV